MRRGRKSRRLRQPPTLPRSAFTAIVIGKLSRVAQSQTRKPTRAFFIACWLISAVANWSGRRKNLSPAPTTARPSETEVLRLLSLLVLLASWWLATLLVGPSKLPPPPVVLAVIMGEARSGALFFNLGVTLGRVAMAFILAITLGGAIGYLMGRVRLANRLGDPWLILLLNLPALVVIVLAYIWAGLTEVAAIVAIAINKLPTAVVTLREGARALDAALDEMATVFALPRWKRFRHVILPQLSPYIAAAARSGLSLVWKIVLVAELLGRPNGVGFEIGVAFQLFDIPLLLAYSLSFAAVVLIIETLLVQPFEVRVSRWRPRAA